MLEALGDGFGSVRLGARNGDDEATDDGVVAAAAAAARRMQRRGGPSEATESDGVAPGEPFKLGEVVTDMRRVA